ncbi:glycerophosphoryl diester phosphodiesterase membrane domain-containing protein [Pontibacter sp. G13]|uniref:glycerophosphoryl diester phosphodiesterase membrane domain-containing protein n=1 Tax=Pontibacter sp. G13 TaxID=3074898 RepID=UPI00288A6611|nr:hypothetical protein [Pontibacter sp. G13]WNJ19864.1 hypothetical protein RJD25_05220 [Pontibacter sp. G13]
MDDHSPNQTTSSYFDLWQYFKTSYQTYRKNLGIYLGFTALSWFIIYSTWGFSFLINLILPIIGLISSIAASAIRHSLEAGYYTGIHAIRQGEKPTIGLFMRGFSVWQSLFFMMIIRGIFMSPFIIIGIVSLFLADWEVATTFIFQLLELNFFSPLEMILSLPELAHSISLLFFKNIGAMISIMGCIYLQISFSFAVPLIAIKGETSMKALKKSWRMTKPHWFKVMIMMAVLGLISLFSWPVLLVGPLLVAGYLRSTIYIAFEDLLLDEEHEHPYAQPEHADISTNSTEAANGIVP